MMPLALTAVDWAIAIASNTHVSRSTISMIAPKSLRQRIGMVSLNCGGRRTTIWSAAPPLPTKSSHDQPGSTPRDPPPRRQAVAARGCGADLRDGDRGRGDAAHRIRSLHRRMEAGHRRHSAVRCACLAGRIREVQDYPAVPRAPSGDEPRCVQNHLLVGMDASAISATRRWRVSHSFSLVSLARLDRAAAAQTIVDDLWFRRGARRHRLVDGGLGSLRAGQGLTVLAGLPSDACLLDLRRRSVDG